MSKHGQAVEGHPNLQFWGPNDFIRVRIRIDDPQVRKIIGKTELVKGLGTQSVPEAVRRSRIPLADFEAKIAEAMLSIGKTTPRTIIYMQTPRVSTALFARQLLGAWKPGQDTEIRFSNPPAEEAIPLAGFTFEAGIDLWVASRGTDNPPAPESVDVYRGHLRRFMTYVGSDNMGDATDQHVIDYPQVLQSGSDGKRRLGNKSVNNNMASIRAVFRVAAHHKRIAADPTKGVAGASNVHKLKVRKNPLKDRKSFDRDQHAKIIAGALTLPKDDPRRWLWLLGAIYGARIAEFAEAKVSAVRTVYGRECFQIGEEFRNTWGGKPISLKTESSPRILPLHSALVPWGFGEYVETIRAAWGDDGPLFPMIPVNRYGKRAHDASRQCNNWLDEIGITDRRYVFHSTRHAVKTFLRGRVPEDVSNAITGHDDGTVAGDYGETELTVMAEAIEAYIPIAAA